MGSAGDLISGAITNTSGSKLSTKGGRWDCGLQIVDCGLQIVDCGFQISDLRQDQTSWPPINNQQFIGIADCGFRAESVAIAPQSTEPFAKFGKRLVYWAWFWKSCAFGDVAADSVRGLPPGRVVPPGSAGVPPASVRAQPGRSALPSIHAKGADSPHSPWGRAPRNGKSGAQSEAVAVARILFAEKRCGRDARAPGWASPP